MKVITTESTCIAAGQCSRTAPNVFKHSDDGGFVELMVEHPPEADHEAVRNVENLCPSGSITVEEDD